MMLRGSLQRNKCSIKCSEKKESEMVASLFSELIKSTVSPYEEMLAYEYLYSDSSATLKKFPVRRLVLVKPLLRYWRRNLAFSTYGRVIDIKKFKKRSIISSVPST